MSICADCGSKAAYSQYTEYGNICLCSDCRDKRREPELIERGRQITHPSDFKQWDSGDMSELFWIHLGKYVKEPNPESLQCMRKAFCWACHDNHGIANSFHHALKWAGIDLYTEAQRWKTKG